MNIYCTSQDYWYVCFGTTFIHRTIPYALPAYTASHHNEPYPKSNSLIQNSTPSIAHVIITLKLSHLVASRSDFVQFAIRFGLEIYKLYSSQAHLYSTTANTFHCLHSRDWLPILKSSNALFLFVENLLYFGNSSYFASLEPCL